MRDCDGRRSPRMRISLPGAERYNKTKTFDGPGRERDGRVGGEGSERDETGGWRGYEITGR